MALVQISQNSYKYRINLYNIAKVYLYFVMNIVDMSYGIRRTVLTKTLVTQLADICGDMWRVITRADSSHIVGKLVTVENSRRHSKTSYELWRDEESCLPQLATYGEFSTR